MGRLGSAEEVPDVSLHRTIARALDQRQEHRCRRDGRFGTLNQAYPRRSQRRTARSEMRRIADLSQIWKNCCNDQLQKSQRYKVKGPEGSGNQPLARRLNRALKDLGVGPLSMPLFDAVVELADAYMQMTVPSFEFPRDIPPSVHFVGALPIIPNQAPIPAWAHELDGSRKVVMVTQGTLANHNFDLLIALASEPDLLVVVTAGGRPVDAIPGPIPSNARLASYLPFEWILPKVDVFVTNGGYGSVNQAPSFGIPPCHRRADRRQSRREHACRMVWRQDRSCDQRAVAGGSAQSRSDRARQTELSLECLVNG